ncbi:MAG: ABC transporter ATP-binding protein [Actinobacteria bacterium]|nr:ABC transporter ATP-binding protein [Actinomycetota bacterium]
MLDADDIVVELGGRLILDGVSLHADRGEVVALQGPSGAGKTTLLRVIAGLVQPRSGTVRLDGVDITTTPVHRRRIGMVFQDNQLFPHRDVAGNVAFGLQMSAGGRGRRAERSARVAEVLELVGLAGFGSRAVTSLSGGEAKRVALARSLAPAPPVLFLDEPLTGLDRELHDRLADDLARLLRVTGTTAIVVTHDRLEAAAIADRTVVLGER